VVVTGGAAAGLVIAAAAVRIAAKKAAKEALEAGVARAEREAVEAAQAAARRTSANSAGTSTGARSCSANSFTADTPVLMADGTQQPIEDVEVGDEVVATDPQTGETAARRVVSLIRHGGQHTMVDVGLADGTVIEATDRHPFWNAGTGAFEYAIDLEPGELVLSVDGSSLPVVSIEVHEEDLTAYNLEIEGIHTYYAGETPVLVHNTCPGAPDLPSPRHSFDEQALHAVASDAKRNGVDAKDAQTLVEWADELGWPSHNIQTHAGRPGFGGTVPHINVGNVKHIPWTGN
jgi:hypothetical protein